MTYEALRALVLAQDPWVILDITAKWGTEYLCYWCEREQNGAKAHNPACLWERLRQEAAAAPPAAGEGGR